MEYAKINVGFSQTWSHFISGVISIDSGGLPQSQIHDRPAPSQNDAHGRTHTPPLHCVPLSAAAK